MSIFFAYIGWFFMPILCIVFCLNLVSIIKKIFNEEPTVRNTFLLTLSFTLIMWSIAIISSIGDA
jgi:hypothetical protein